MNIYQTDALKAAYAALLAEAVEMQASHTTIYQNLSGENPELSAEIKKIWHDIGTKDLSPEELPDELKGYVQADDKDNSLASAFHDIAGQHPALKVLFTERMEIPALEPKMVESYIGQYHLPPEDAKSLAYKQKAIEFFTEKMAITLEANLKPGEDDFNWAEYVAFHRHQSEVTTEAFKNFAELAEATKNGSVPGISPE